MTTEGLIQLINDRITDNVTGDISPDKMREVLFNMVQNAGVKIVDNTVSNDVTYSSAKIEAMINSITSGMEWKPSLETYGDIAVRYPYPQDGWTVNVKDTDITYRYDGLKWIAISANSIPLATAAVDGKMSKEDKFKLDNVAAEATKNQSDVFLLNRANHSGTQDAATIIQSASLRFMTDTERTKLNGIANGATKNQTDSFLLSRANHTGTQPISSIEGLQSELDSKTGVGAHTHTWDDITLKPDVALNGHTHIWTDIQNKPSTFAPSSHTHTIANITSLQTALDGKSSTVHSHSISDVANLAMELSNKAGTIHTHSWDDISPKPDFAISGHGHVWTDITGTAPVNKGGTGLSTVTSGNFLRGNGTGVLTQSTPAQVLTAIGAAPLSHSHSISDITGLSVELLAKADKVHTHTWDDISPKPDFAISGHGHVWADITGTAPVNKGGTGLTSLTSGSFLRGNGTSGVTMRTPAQVLGDIGAAPVSHSHGIGDVTGLLTELLGKADSVHTHTWDDLTIKPDFALNGHTHSYSSLTGIPTSFTPSAHFHSAADITSGTLTVARGGTGLATVTTGNFLRGNGTSAMTQSTPAQVLAAIGAAPLAHSHGISDVTGLATELLGKASTVHTHTWDDISPKPDFALNGHTHTAADISGTIPVSKGGTGLTTVTSGNFLRGNGTGNFTQATPAQVLTAIGAAPASHTHSIADVTGLSAELLNKANAVHSHAWDDITLKPDFAISGHGHFIADVSGLQTALDGKAATSHNHSATNITSGTLAVARGGTGLATVTAGNFLVGNGTGNMVQKTPSEVATIIDAATSTDILNETRYRHAQNSITGGGTVTWSGTHLKWTQRFIAIPVDKSIGSAGYIDFAMPNSGVVIQGINGASNVTVTTAGIPLDDWTALIAFHTIAGSNTAVSYRVMRYNEATANALHTEHFVIAIRNGEMNGTPVRLCNGFSLRSGNSLVNGTFGSTTFSGDIYATGQTTAFSDARLKTNVTEYERGLEKVMKLRPVTYDRIDIESDDEIGFIAQEVQEVEPNLVKERGHLSLDYSRMVVMLTKAVQEQQHIISRLIKKVEGLENASRTD